MTDFEKPEITYYNIVEPKSDWFFSILIPSWNNLEYLKLCIESIHKNSLYKHQIIIHVNEGTDGTFDWIKQTNLDYTYSKTNAGVCYALNAMAKLAKTNYILYLNDDMFVCKNWDEPLVKAAKNSLNQLFYYSGTMIEPNDSGNNCVIANKNFGDSPKNFDEEALNYFIEHNAFNDWFGSCWPPSLVSKKLWGKVGGYSEEFSPGFYSDPDFAMKLWKIGVRDFRGFGNSLVYHFKCKSTGRVKRNNGRKTFAKKWGIPSSYFYKNVLLMGQPYNKNINLKMKKNIKYFVARLKAAYISWM
ncbi:MAG: glycosyltransferase family 2 protein [Bacteroidia bacterium]